MSGWRDLTACAALTAVTVWAFRRALGFYFLADDFSLVKLAGASHLAIIPWFKTPGGDGFFRPIANISFELTAPWAGANPFLWHAAALALHIANSILVYMLAFRLGRSRVAALGAALLFAIHGTRPEAVVWIAGRFDLLAAFFVLSGLLLFERSLGEPSPAGPLYRAASLAATLLAILSKESAYVFPLLAAPLLFCHRGRPRTHAAVLLPYFATAAALFAWRWCLFGGIGGYRDARTGRAQALMFGLGTLKALGLRLWAALFFPINWSAQPSAWMVAAMLAYLGALLWLAFSRPERLRMAFALGFLLISVLPPLHLLGIGKELVNSRVLYLPSVGFCLMLAVAADALRGPSRWIIPVAILLFHFTALEHNLDLWADASAKAQAASAAILSCPGADANLAASGVPGRLRGVPFLANVTRQTLVLQPGGAPSAHHAVRSSFVWNPATERVDCLAAP